jgi:hypothetical protein
VRRPRGALTPACMVQRGLRPHPSQPRWTTLAGEAVHLSFPSADGRRPGRAAASPPPSRARGGPRQQSSPCMHDALPLQHTAPLLRCHCRCDAAGSRQALQPAAGAAAGAAGRGGYDRASRLRPAWMGELKERSAPGLTRQQA